MKKALKRCLSVLLAVVVLCSAFSSFGELDFSGSFAVEANAANDKNLNDAMYIVQESVTCDGKITYIVYLKSGLKVSGANVNVEFDEKALTVYDGGAYTKVDEYGDLTPVVPGMYEYGFRLNSTNICSIGYVNIDPSLLTKDTPFLKITFKINDGYDVADVKLTCIEFLCENEELNVTKAEKPVVMLEEKADLTKPEHISGDWVHREASVHSAGVKYRDCTVCGQIIESFVLPQLLCEKPGLLGVFPDDIGLIFIWNTVEGADSYAVYRKTESTDWEFLSEAAYNTTSYLDVDVEEEILYFYTVRAVNEAGESGYDTEGVSGEYHIHKFSPWETIVSPTCTTAGSRKRTCPCGEEEIIDVAALGHTISDEWIIDVKPTCTNNGSKSHHCTVCGEKVDVTVIMATGHNYEIVSAASVHPHTTLYKCSYCANEKTETSVVSDCIECIYGTDLPIKETANTKIDYVNFLIFTDVQNSNDVFEILGVAETAIVMPVASVMHGNIELYGTGTVFSVFNDSDYNSDYDYVGDFTLIVEGDLNGDSTCDVLDAAAAHLYSVGLDEPNENEILAANACISDEIDANSYQNVVNMMLAS